MSIWHVLAVLFAIVGVAPAITLLSPVKVAHRAVPLIMIVIALGLWFLPTGITVALALVPAAAWISARLGIEHAGHEPANVAPALQRARSAVQKLRERVVKAAPVQLQEFATRAYPAPGEPETGELEPADDAPVSEDDQDDDKPETSPAEAARKRPEGMAGLRSQSTTPARKFVPSLLG